MAHKKRKFTEEQKLDILKQAEKIGISQALRIHSLSYSVFARWRTKMIATDSKMAAVLFKNKTKSELKQFMEENVRLKKIIADQALELERKAEELRKGGFSFNKR